MMRTLIFAAVIAPGLLCAEQLNLRWAEIPGSIVTGRKVAVHLRDGAVLRGKAMSMTPGGLQMAVSNAPKGAVKYGKGEFLIPAGEVASLKVNRTGKRGRIIGSVIGGVLGGVAGFFGRAVGANEGTMRNAPIVAALFAVPLGIGYLIGWAMDLKTTTIQVIAEPNPR
jgi:hypothetical protein